MSDDYNDAFREYEKEQEAEFDEYRKAVKAWKIKWPAHCVHCGGWGGHVHYENHGFDFGLSEQLFDTCKCLDSGDKCPRCGGHGLTVTEDDCLDMDKECTECGWKFDDGMPNY